MLEELVALRREVEQLRADLRRLPAPTPTPAPAPEEAKPSQPEANQQSDPHGFRPLVDSLRNQTLELATSKSQRSPMP